MIKSYSRLKNVEKNVEKMYFEFLETFGLGVDALVEMLNLL